MPPAGSLSCLAWQAVVLVDTGFHLYLWVGTGTAFSLRVSAFTFAQAYVTKFKRPSVLPLTRFAEGQESDKFWRLFSKPQGYRIDAKPEPERLHPMMRTKPKPRLHAQQKSPAAPPTEASPTTTTTTTASAAKSPSTGTVSPPLPPGDVGVVVVGGGGGSVAVPRLPTARAASAAQEALGANPPDASRDDDEEEEDEDDENALLTSEDIPTSEKLKCIDGVCYPVVSDAWGCCMTSVGCSWKDRVACLGLDLKGLYSPCMQIEAMALKPAFDKKVSPPHEPARER